MFNSKLEARISKLEAELESFKQDVVRCRNITVYKDDQHGAYFLGQRPYQQMSHQDAIYKILGHLGLELTYVEGQPTRVDLVKNKK